VERFVRHAFYPVAIGSILVAACSVAAGTAPTWLVLPAVVAVAIMAIARFERRHPFEPAWLRDHGDARADAIHAVANWALLAVGGWTIDAIVRSVVGTTGAWPVTWPAAAQLLLVALVLDLGLYAMHVASHRWPWAWRLHAVHHAAERLYWLNGERRHPLSALLMGGPGLLVLALLGAPPLLTSAWLAVVAVHLAFQHANLDYRLGPLRRWIAGAETHRWHHQREYEDAQVNFGEMLLVWDRLFGTFRDVPERIAADAVGLRARTAPTGYVAQLAWPFRVSRALRAAFAGSLRAADLAASASRPAEALAHLEDAHVLGQRATCLHVRSHLALLRFGWRARSPRQVSGQLLRLVAAAALTWAWMPAGNPGSTGVPLLARRPVAPEVASILDRDDEG
jgi:sterol desaturase/sphingolipid hydroxylase (fatty acid hydroxylase superfamily)